MVGRLKRFVLNAFLGPAEQSRLTESTVKAIFTGLLSLLLVGSQWLQAHAPSPPKPVRVCQCRCCDPAECCMAAAQEAPPAAPAVPARGVAHDQTVFLPVAPIAFAQPPLFAGSGAARARLISPTASAASLYQRDCRYRL